MSGVGDLSGWLPQRVFREQGEWRVEWWRPGDLRLDTPFYRDAVQMAQIRAAGGLRGPVTALSELERLAERRPAVPPAGFVYHMSRCGSTLVARMLAAHPRHVVLSEPEPLDAVVRAPIQDGSMTEEQAVRTLRAMLHLLALPRFGEERLFVKWDSWSILSLPLIRKAFPEVPWIFLYRDPVEVLVSHQRLRGMQMIPGELEPALLGLAPDELPPPARLDEYAVLVVRAILAGAGAHCREAGGRPVRYEELPGAFRRQIAPFLGIPDQCGELARCEAAARKNAKCPTEPFIPDAAAKQAEASPELRALAGRLLAPLVLELDQLRSQRGRWAMPSGRVQGPGRKYPGGCPLP